MKISHNWLKSYIETDLDPTKIAELLTDGGLEVEEVTEFESIKGGLKGIVIGQVMECEKHPNADKLSITKVDIGNSSLTPIVCGAPNVAVGQKVLVATVGTTLYTGTDSFIIKSSKIRGEISEGMICAEDEIGIGTSHDGILVLPTEVKVGTLASDYFKIANDFVYEIGLTPNRVDASNHIGVARDLVALLNQNTQIKNHKLNLISLKPLSVGKPLPIIIEVKNEEACPRYAGVCIANIEVNESPDWLKNRIKSIGLRPINNVVDITNFVLMELGQPLHAFDYDKINGHKIIVQTLTNGATFTTLDETERNLHSDDLMICNQDLPMCIAGVFGGLNSGVTNKTKNIFLESAYFNPSFVRKTSKRHNLKTDAAFRFERGTDPNGVVFALRRAAELIIEICGGEIASEIQDVYNKPIKNVQLDINLTQINKLIGQNIPSNEVKSILKDLGIIIINESPEVLSIEIPTYKVDVTREADIVEEILRIYGYNNIKIDEKLNASINFTKKPESNYLLQLASEYLSANGFTEIMNNSLSKSEYSTNDYGIDKTKTVNIINPLSSELNTMRQNLLFGALESIKRNFNYKNYDLKFYEFGSHYTLKSESFKSINESFNEEQHLALFLTGNRVKTGWMSGVQPNDFYYTKFIAQSLFQRLNVDISFFKTAEITNYSYEYGISYSKGDKTVMEIGKVSKLLLKQFDISQDVFIIDINWSAYLETQKQSRIIFKEISNFPEVRRDLALLVNKDISFGMIEEICFNTEKHLLKEVSLFDIYEGNQVEKSKKSYAISLVIQDSQKTLTDKQIDKLTERVVHALNDKLGATLR